jgi:hypothetical protein
LEQPGVVFAPQDVVRLTATVPPRKQGEGREQGIPRLEWQLIPIGATKAVGTHDVRFEPAGNGQATDVPVELTLPKEEGVYTLRLALFGRKVPRSERNIQLVVIDGERRETTEARPTANRLVDSFDPTGGGLFRKVSLDTSGKKLDSPLARLLRFPKHDADSKPVALAQLSAVAYRLKVIHPGRPHLVEIICPANVEQSGSVCLVEGDEQGQFVPLGPECSFVIGGGGKGEHRSGRHDEPAVHRQIFWPNDRDPALVIVGRQAGRPLEVDRVQLYELGNRLFAPEIETRKEEPTEGAPPVRQRLVGPCLRLVDLPRNFCGPRSSDPQLGDDWQTHTLAGRRLIEYLLYREQNALLLALPSEITTILSEQVIPGDGQISEAQNPSTLDVLELLLRLFDRSGLVLIPELRFDSPLEVLSTREDTGKKTGEVHLLDGTGRTHADLGQPADDGPHYNPLSDRVQQTVQGVVAELLKRFSGHPSFGGVAFRLGPQSCLQFPGIEWGYDPDSIHRFERFAQVRIPRIEGVESQAAAYQYLTTTARREWVRFRAGELAAFHRRLAELVVESLPDAHVLFSGQLAPTGDAGFATAMVGMVRAGINPARLLADQGLEFSLPPYASDPHVTVLRPVVRLEGYDATLQAAAASLNLSPAIDALYRGASPGGLLQPLAPKSSLPLFNSPDGLSWDMVSAIDAATAPHHAADGPYAQLLATLDAQICFAGAGVLGLVPAPAAQSLSVAITHLPGVPFRPAGPQIQPVVVRSAQLEHRTWIYVVNASSLPLATEMVLDCRPSTPGRSPLDGESIALSASANKKSRVRIDLPGYGLWAVQLEHAGVSVSETQVTVGEAGLAEFQQRIDHLHANMKVAALASSKSTQHVAHKPVESHEAQLAGWEFTARQPDSLNGDEVRQLTKTVSSVKLAWEEGRYADCQRMLDGYWGQLLLSMPVEAPPVSPARSKVTGRLRDKLKR